MKKVIFPLLILLPLQFSLAISPLPPVAKQTASGLNQTGLPLPRFASLRYNGVNVYVGPGREYPIEWKLLKQKTPIEIIAEFDIWRRIRDSQGTTGWVHKTCLSGKRTVIVKAATNIPLHKNPDHSSPILLLLEPKVVADVLEVKYGWCKVKVQRTEGWVLLKHIWGVYPNEKKIK
jgi:SH3-like domain-containing protein